MNKLLKHVAAVGAFSAASLLAHAQATPRIAVVDMQRIFENHYETIEQGAKLKQDEQKVQDQIDQMNKEGNSLYEEYKELDEQAKNPTATADAKAKVSAQAQDKMREVQAKVKDIQEIATAAKQRFQQRIETFRTTMLQTISSVAIEVAKRDGANLLIDKSGATLIGIPAIIYSDPSFDITDQVMAEINKNRPHTDLSVSPNAPTAPAASSSSSSGTEAAPKIVVPGITPGN